MLTYDGTLLHARGGAMKPCIVFRRGVWSCRTLVYRPSHPCLSPYVISGVIGYGYTPRDAYLDWQRYSLNARPEVPHE